MPLALAELLIRRCRPCFRPGARRLLRSLADVECSPSSSFAAPRRPVGLAPVMAPDFCLIRDTAPPGRRRATEYERP